MDEWKVKVPIDAWKGLLVLLLFLPTCNGCDQATGSCGTPIAVKIVDVVSSTLTKTSSTP